MDAFNTFDGAGNTAFDFTLLFEQRILSLLPSLIVLVLALLRLYALRTEPRRVQGRVLQAFKLCAIVSYAALQLAALVLWGRISFNRQDHIAVAATALALFDACLFCPLSWLEHTRSLQPSAVLLLYFGVSLLFDVFQLRTLWIQEFQSAILGTATACLCMKLVIVVLESIEKFRFSSATSKAHSPEEWSGLWSQGVCYWLNALLLKGYQGRLSAEDLYPLPQDLHSEALDTGVTPSPGLLGIGRELITSLGWSLAYPAVPRLLLVGFNLSQPLLIKAILTYLRDVGNKNRRAGTDSFIIVAVVLVYLGIALCTSIYWQLQLRNLTKLRGILTCAIFRKVTTLPSAVSDTAAVTLMSTDVERVVQGARVFHEAWANVAEVGLAVWLLERELQVGSIAPIVVATVCFLATLGLNKLTLPRQSRWMEALQGRVSTTLSLLSCMKGIRMTGLSDKSYHLVQSLRLRELKYANGFRMIQVLSFCIAFAPIFITPVACFGIYLEIARGGGESQTFDAATAFTSLSLVVVLTQPLSSLFQFIPMFLGAANCLQRIQAFLQSESRRDPRKLAPYSVIRPGFDVLRTTETSLEKASSPSTSGIMIADGNKPNAFAVHDGEFGWKTSVAVLRDVNITITKSQFTLIVGPVASGKTTLCKVLLGEISQTRGSIYLEPSSADIAFCDQTPYLTNTTIRDNIIGCSSIDEALYKTVVHAVDLDTDLPTLSKGDQTLVGNNGDALSTGQRQRVAVARALYARKPVIILDDVFNGMDNITKSRIYTRLLGPRGLLRTRSTTVVMTCHEQQPSLAVDHVITLRPGEPPIAGSPFLPPDQGSGDEMLETPPENTINDTEPTRTMESRSGVEQSKEPNSTHIKSKGGQSPMKGSDWQTYRYFANAAGLPNVILLMILGAAFGVLYTFPSVWVDWWTTDSATKDDFYLGIYALLQSGALVCWFLFTRHSLTTVASRSGARLHDMLLSTVLSASYPYLSSRDTGVIINKFSQDLQLVDGELPAALLNTVATAFIALAQVGLVATASPWLAISYPFLVLVFYAIQKFYLRTSQQLRPLDLELKSPLYSHFLDTLRGINTIRAFGWCQKHIERNCQLLDASQSPFYLLPMIQQWLALVLNIVVLVLATLLVTLTLKLQSGLGFTAVALVNLISLSQMLRSVIVGWTLMETSITAVSRIREFQEGTPKEQETSIEANGEVSFGWPLHGKVECQGLSVSYGSSSDRMALEDVDIVIEAGEKFGLCGRSGSGKSSFVASLLRMLDVRRGRIVIDSVDIGECPLSALRSSINVIPQDPFFIEGTFRANLDPYEKVSSDAAIEQALKKLHLWDEVQAQGGLDGEMKPENFSQGQKQLLSLGRAMLRHSKIVIVDEVTSSLDLETERLVWKILQDEFRGCTMIAIAHRLETIIGFDRVAVFDEGKLVECDDPRSLLQRPGSAFARLWSAGDKAT